MSGSVRSGFREQVGSGEALLGSFVDLGFVGRSRVYPAETGIG